MSLPNKHGSMGDTRPIVEVSLRDADEYYAILGSDYGKEVQLMVNGWESTTPYDWYINGNFKHCYNQLLEVIVTELIARGFKPEDNTNFRIIYGESGKVYTYNFPLYKGGYPVNEVPVHTFIELMTHYLTDTLTIILKHPSKPINKKVESQKWAMDVYYTSVVNRITKISRFLNDTNMEKYYIKHGNNLEDALDDILLGVRVNLKDALGNDYEEASNDLYIRLVKDIKGVWYG